MNKFSSFVDLLSKAAVVIAAGIPIFFLIWSFIDFVESYVGYKFSVVTNVTFAISAAVFIGIYASICAHPRWWVYGSWLLFFIIKLSSYRH
jgi:hypothetical protein